MELINPTAPISNAAFPAWLCVVICRDVIGAYVKTLLDRRRAVVQPEVERDWLTNFSALILFKVVAGHLNFYGTAQLINRRVAHRAQRFVYIIAARMHHDVVHDHVHRHQVGKMRMPSRKNISVFV